MISLIVALVIVGVLLYVMNTVIPMDGKVKTIINAVVILALCLWVAEGFGLIGGGHGLQFRGRGL